jgi:uncharacterized protein (DUF58 family)
MIPKEVIRKIRRIQITTSRKVTDVFAGKYQSVFKGSGMEFDEVRNYNPGDEIRSIDWNVTARMGHPFVKKFVEERELTIMILLDVSMSEKYGTTGNLKSEVAAELCSVIAFSATQNNDKVGMITFTDRVERFIPPRKGLRHVLRVIREGLYNSPSGSGTDIKNVLEHLNRVSTRRTITFVISDFIDEGYAKTLAITNKRHDVIAVSVTDPSEVRLPSAGIVRLEDAETGDIFDVDTSSREAGVLYERSSERFLKERSGIFKEAGVDNIDIRTDRSYVEPLIRFFRKRSRRMAAR